VHLPVHACDLASEIGDLFAVPEALVEDLHGSAAVELLQGGGDSRHFFSQVFVHGEQVVEWRGVGSVRVVLGER
jgi:hypothetical protein